MPTDDQEWIERWVRLETKIDLVVKDHGDQINDHEDRIRSLEQRPVVTPRGLVAAISSAVVILGGLVGLLSQVQIGA